MAKHSKFLLEITDDRQKDFIKSSESEARSHFCLSGNLLVHFFLLPTSVLYVHCVYSAFHGQIDHEKKENTQTDMCVTLGNGFTQNT